MRILTIRNRDDSSARLYVLRVSPLQTPRQHKNRIYRERAIFLCPLCLGRSHHPERINLVVCDSSVQLVQLFPHIAFSHSALPKLILPSQFLIC